MARGSSASRRRGEGSVPQGLRPGLPPYAPDGAGNRSALQTVYAPSLSDNTLAGEYHGFMGAGVRTAFVAPILVLFRHGLTRGTAVGAVLYRAHGGEEAEKKECLFFTNEATMLLKTKDRQNEQSQTKPILEHCRRRRFCCHRRWRDEPAATPEKTQKRAK